MSGYWIDKERDRRENLAAFFRSQYGRAPARWFSAPGRAELLGAYSHFDYGKTLLCALSCDVLCAAEERKDGIVEILSEEALPIRFSVHDLESREREKGKPVAIFRGVLGYLKKHGYSFGGFSVCLQNAVPSPAGPCAALESLVSALVETFYLAQPIPAETKVRAGQYAENVYYGKAGGFSEQTASVAGGCSELDMSSGLPAATRLPAPEGYGIALVRAGEDFRPAFFERTKKQLAEVAAFYGKRSILEVPFGAMREDLNLLRRKVSDGAVLRAFDYFEENERVRLAGEALLSKNADGFLQQIEASGQSALRDIYDRQNESAAEVAIKMGGYLLKNGACTLLRGTGTLVAVAKEEEAQDFFRAMARLFGRENVFLASICKSGAREIRC